MRHIGVIERMKGLDEEKNTTFHEVICFEVKLCVLWHFSRNLPFTRNFRRFISFSLYERKFKKFFNIWIFFLFLFWFYFSIVLFFCHVFPSLCLIFVISFAHSSLVALVASRRFPCSLFHSRIFIFFSLYLIRYSICVNFSSVSSPIRYVTLYIGKWDFDEWLRTIWYLVAAMNASDDPLHDTASSQSAAYPIHVRFI